MPSGHFQQVVGEGAPRAPLRRVRAPVGCSAMQRPTRFETHQYVGDKRNQVVHDVDACTAPDVIDELLEAETYLAFGPDSLPEARNRGYRRCDRCDGMRAAQD